MKCLLCPNEIDETREIHRDDLNAQRTHSAALDTWRQVTAYVSNEQILVGHVCPSEVLTPGGVTLARTDGSSKKAKP
jgi:hypothetical protein